MSRVARSRVGLFALGAVLGLHLHLGSEGAPAVAADDGVLLGVFVVQGAAEASDAELAQLQDDLRATAGDRVFFAEGSSELGAKGLAVVAAQAAWLHDNPGFRLRIEGHADEPGGTARNVELSLRRAQAVWAELVASGIPRERVRVEALSNARPVAVCGQNDCAAQNRRAVSIVDLATPVPARAADRAVQGPSPSAPTWGERVGTR